MSIKTFKEWDKEQELAERSIPLQNGKTLKVRTLSSSECRKLVKEVMTEYSKELAELKDL